MRTLLRNKQRLYYANCVGDEDIMQGGKYTGLKKVVYTEPKVLYANISAARGSSDIDPFGIDTDYDRAICIEDTDITESSIIWIDISPTEPHNYIVKRVAKSLNSTTIAVKHIP